MAPAKKKTTTPKFELTDETKEAMMDFMKSFLDEYLIIEEEEPEEEEEDIQEQNWDEDDLEKALDAQFYLFMEDLEDMKLPGELVDYSEVIKRVEKLQKRIRSMI